MFLIILSSSINEAAAVAGCWSSISSRGSRFRNTTQHSVPDITGALSFRSKQAFFNGQGFARRHARLDYCVVLSLSASFWKVNRIAEEDNQSPSRRDTTLNPEAISTVGKKEEPGRGVRACPS